MASAAATSISGVMSEAPASSSPRKKPGKASTLLIWLGKSLRPVATTAACLEATAGSISGRRVGHGEHDGVLGHRGNLFLADHVRVR